MGKSLLMYKWVMKEKHTDEKTQGFNLKKSRGKQTGDMKHFKHGIPDLSSPYTVQSRRAT